ncbi:hypothetical protein N7474_000152 [Penicillium riverlandense]|uniref:uncharacterized protein n=1 Tax=Penicillium riverlandense TaxID=1903569 RepID=UPI002547415B|nr:uncharacterized protein N7474_000152 [Penicillium riverlandense]KAJ5831841.1 hypothetical protein N7474_000152 [Penicillium riverlandense]
MITYCPTSEAVEPPGKMDKSTTPLDLHRLSHQSMHKRYESDEEIASESDAGWHDLPPLIGSQPAAESFDSDLSDDDHLLAPTPAKPQRSVSVDTVKENRDAGFVDVFDPEDDMVLELSSPPARIASKIFVPPTIYISPNSPPKQHSRPRSPSLESECSVEDADIQVAKQITITQPPTRPTLVFIDQRFKGSRARPSQSHSREPSRRRESRLFSPLTDIKSNSPRLNEGYELKLPRTIPSPPATIDEGTPLTPIAHSAAIRRVSEVPLIPYFPLTSPRPLSKYMHHARPRTAGSDKPLPNPGRHRRPTEPGRRPPSIRSSSSNSVPSSSYSSSRESSPFTVASDTDGTSLHSLPVSKRTLNLLASRPPLMMRRMTRKNSIASSTASMNSLRSEANLSPSANNNQSLHASASHTNLHPQTQQLRHQSVMNLHLHSNPIYHSNETILNMMPAPPLDPRPVRKSSLMRKSSHRRHVRHSTSIPSGRGFLGLKFGPRSPRRA